MTKENILIDVVMPAFNHEKYISQAIESVLAQECNFDFRIIIGEDCSTDNTRVICEKFQMKFPDKILLLKNNTNLGLIRNYVNIFNHCKYKYIAILESDDYWIDSTKLQTQIEILETNEKIGLVHTRSATLYENGDLKIDYNLKQSRYKFDELFKKIILDKYNIAPLTVCFRRDLLMYIDFNFCIEKSLKTLDHFLWLEFSMQTEFFFIDKLMAHYRSLDSSESNSKDFNKIKSFVETSQIIKLYYLEKYPLKKLTQKRILADGNYRLINEYLNKDDFEMAKKLSKDLNIGNVKSFFIALVSNFKYLYFLLILRNKAIMYLSKSKQTIYPMLRNYLTKRL